MKKVFTLVTLLALASSYGYANCKAGTGACMGKGKHMMSKYGLKHANPMPNLMRIVVGNSALLKLSQEQLKEVKAWVEESKPKMKGMIHTVMMQERALMENALGEDRDMSKEIQEMLNTRKAIIEMKNSCRATLKKILSKEQYEQTITIYQSTK
jgi:hypothetical protein